MKTEIIPRWAVMHGDILVDVVGRPYFRVDEVHQARAKGYLVFLGERLVPGEGRTEGGHKNGLVTVQREEA